MISIPREGGNITAADMVESVTEFNKIQRNFAGSVVFVTGATGFLGKLLVEKLLRTCYLKKIYVLVRPKKGKTCEQRFQDYFDDPLYEPLKREQGETLGKLFMIMGDCAFPGMGLSDYDRKLITSEVNHIFHLAATVRFDEKLRRAAYINVRCTKDILAVAKNVQDLRSFVYVSTAYSFCPKRTIDEVFYEPTVTGEELLMLVETFTDDKLQEMVPAILGKWPNTYAFTKSIAEDVVKKEGKGLPIVLIRPSIVTATAREPVCGWIDNFYGPTGLCIAGALGFLRTAHLGLDNMSDLVPADYVINCSIAAAWDIATMKGSDLNLVVYETTNEQCETDIPIYNYVSSSQNPITWNETFNFGLSYLESLVSVLQVWQVVVYPTSNKYLFLFLHYILHLIPAYIIDFLASFIGKKPGLVKAYKKLEKFLSATSYFTTAQWTFCNNNTQKLWNKLTFEDKAMFEFDIKALEWKTYFNTYAKGVRVYVLKDPLDTIPQGKAKLFKLKIAHYILVAVLLFLILMLILLLRKLF